MPAGISVPELSLVVLVGISGSGKSSFAAKHFRATEVVSSDYCRALVSDDETDQSASADAFELLHFIVAKRLERGKLVVVDATNVQPEARRPLVALAKRYHVLPVAVVLDVPEAVCAQRNTGRPGRDFGAHVLRNQSLAFRRSKAGLRREGFHRAWYLGGPDEINAATVERTRLWADRRSERGPFDIIGDVHGCCDELVELLSRLGYAVDPDGSGACHPEGRKAVFVGDLVDRGPATPAVLRLAMGMVASGDALCVPGNHEAKLLRALRAPAGNNMDLSHGLAGSLAQLSSERPGFSSQVADFIDGLVSHLVLDDGNLVVAHAGMRADMAGRASGAVRAFALYGDTTGETDELGLPVRYPWADDYRGEALVVYGHTPVAEPAWVNRTICIDTGCVFGGRLTALRYPEREIVTVPARRVHWEPTRPLASSSASPPVDAGREPGDLDIEDVLGKRTIMTRLAGAVTVREDNAAAALEVMSRFAVSPRWMVYLPPTMAPPPTSSLEGCLEHPAEVFGAFRRDGAERVVCEEKHMGSRSVVVLCRDGAVAERRFGAGGVVAAAAAATDGGAHAAGSAACDSGPAARGAIMTRTGRPFFTDGARQDELLVRLGGAVDNCGLWEELRTDWLVLDCELMPWSVKAMELVRHQYAAVGAAANAAAAAELVAVQAAAGRGVDLGALVERAAERLGTASGFRDAYRRYCWEVRSVDDVRLAPFQILAGEGKVYALNDHLWHMSVLGRLCEAGAPVLQRTRAVTVDIGDEASEAAAIAWWEELTASGGEGMVVKPVEVVHRGPKGLAQPGIKCRGREYLRIIYGPEYTSPGNLKRLRVRGLGHKSSLARREFALGIEALERFVAGEPLYRVHECVFGVLALESEPVDPRL
jgi:protein phosphatase